MHIQPHSHKVYTTGSVLRLAPHLIAALRELAAAEGFSLPALVSILLLEALRARSRRQS
jgi:hypothetical protein